MSLIGCGHLLITITLLAGAYAGLTEDQKAQLLNAHNDFRAQVSPPVWNNELATLAQNYANRCIWGNNPSRKSPSFSYVGENLYTTSGDTPNYRTVVQSWFNEAANYDYQRNTCATGKVCGHYTQVVWADSNNLGCGVKRCPTAVGLSFRSALIVVCNYGPGGNYVGQKPYQPRGRRGAIAIPGPRDHCRNQYRVPPNSGGERGIDLANRKFQAQTYNLDDVLPQLV